jgi:DNA-binding GntR family transcriptional regulator
MARTRPSLSSRARPSTEIVPRGGGAGRVARRDFDVSKAASGTPRVSKIAAVQYAQRRATRPVLVRRTLQDNIYDYLRDGLMSGEYVPGERLTVRGVAARMGTSVMPVREAFRRLTSEGGLEPLSTGATRVPVFDRPKLQDLTEIRLVVEGLAARRAAHRITSQECVILEELNADVLRAAEHGDRAAEARANERFHFYVYRAAQSAELLRIIEHLWLQIGPCLAWVLKRNIWPPRTQRPGARFRCHRDLLLALRRHDAEQAEAAIRGDLTTAAAVLIEHVAELGTVDD